MNQQVLITHPLSELELSIMQFIHEFGFCEINHIMKRFSLRRTFCYEQMKIMKRFGLMNYKIVLPHNPAVYFLTAKAMKLINTDLPLFTYIPTNNYCHYMEVLRVYFTVRKNYPDSSWITERRLIRYRQDDMAGNKEHLPDGMVMFANDKRIPIEVELTLKSRERLIAILSDYSVDENVHEVWYFCPPKIKSILQEMIVKLPKIKLHLLNEETSI